MGIYHSSTGLLTNNSVIRADNGFLRGSIFCLSGRREAGIGQWIAPNGNDYTIPGTHAFEVSVDNPGVVEISVSGSDDRFPAGQWDGIYSCVIPDETGTEQRIYLGIYLVFGELLLGKITENIYDLGLHIIDTTISQDLHHLQSFSP